MQVATQKILSARVTNVRVAMSISSSVFEPVPDLNIPVIEKEANAEFCAEYNYLLGDPARALKLMNADCWAVAVRFASDQELNLLYNAYHPVEEHKGRAFRAWAVDHQHELLNAAYEIHIWMFHQRSDPWRVVVKPSCKDTPVQLFTQV